MAGIGIRIEGVAGLDLTVAAGERIAMLGGAGTKLLRAIAGLDRLRGGGRVRDAAGRRLSHAGLGAVLRPDWMAEGDSVARAVALPMRQWRLRAGPRRALVETVLDLCALLPLASERVGRLTPADRQRAVLARALAGEPRLLLLDDPLSAQPPVLRRAMHAALRRAQAMLGATMIVATPDGDEAAALGDRVAVLGPTGALLQCDRPAMLRARPASAAVARLVSACTCLPGRLVAAEEDEAEIALAAGGGGGDGPPMRGMLASAGATPRPGSACLLCVAPEHVALLPGELADDVLRGVITEIVPEGDRVRVRLLLGTGAALEALRPAAASVGLRLGETVGVSWQPQHGIVL